MNTVKEVYLRLSTATIVNAILLILLVVFLFSIKAVILVLLTSIVIASFVESGVIRLARIGIKRTMAVLIIYFSGLLLFAALFYAFLPIFTNEISDLIQLLANELPATSFLTPIQDGSVGEAQNLISNISSDITLDDLVTRVQFFVAGVSGGFINAVSVLFGGIFNLILLIILSFYLSMQEKGVENFLRIITPKAKEPQVISLWQRTERKIALWVQGQLLLGFIIGMITYIGLLLMGVQYALLLAIVVAICELIPFGIILGAIPAIIFGYIDGGISLAFMVTIFYVIVQQVEGYVLQPLVVKKIVGVSPLVVILALLIGAKLAGFWGILLAVPVAVCFLELMSDLEKKKQEA